MTGKIERLITFKETGALVALEVLPNVHQITSPLGNRYVSQYLLVGDRAWLLVDTGVAGMVDEKIAPYIDELTATKNKKAYVVITHGDVDHLGGNSEIKRHYPNSTLMAHQKDSVWIENRDAIMNEQYGWYRQHGMDYEKEVIEWIQKALGDQIPVDFTLTGGEEVKLSHDWKVKIVSLPGHSPGHIGIYDPLNNAVIISDAVLYRGLLDSSGKVISPPKYYNAQQYVDTIKYLMKINADYILTAHYGILSHQEAANFLQESLNFVKKVERATYATLKKSAKPMTLKEIVDAVNQSVGPFTSFQIELAAGILSHLNAMVGKKVAKQTKKMGYPAWQIVKKSGK